jgi:hypothetical protein
MKIMRRRLGTAYDRSPYERFSEWGTRNLLVLFSALFVGLAWWLFIDWLVGTMLNSLVRGTDETALDRFDIDDPAWIATKIIGGIIAMYLVCRNRAQ